LQAILIRTFLTSVKLAQTGDATDGNSSLVIEMPAVESSHGNKKPMYDNYIASTFFSFCL